MILWRRGEEWSKAAVETTGIEKRVVGEGIGFKERATTRSTDFILFFFFGQSLISYFDRSFLVDFFFLTMVVYRFAGRVGNSSGKSFPHTLDMSNSNPI